MRSSTSRRRTHASVPNRCSGRVARPKFGLRFNVGNSGAHSHSFTYLMRCQGSSWSQRVDTQRLPAPLCTSGDGGSKIITCIRLRANERGAGSRAAAVHRVTEQDAHPYGIPPNPIITIGYGASAGNSAQTRTYKFPTSNNSPTEPKTCEENAEAVTRVSDV
jgi:hypothetical protein